MMKAVRLNHFGEDLCVVEEGVPRCRRNEILIDVKACGFCHTDLHVINGDWQYTATLPICPGHEGAGIVCEIGEDVRNFKVGDRVGVPWLYSACGACEFCITGWETLCAQQKNCGFSVDGCLRQVTVAPADHAVPIPDGLELEQAAPILCAGVTSYKAIKESEARAGQFIVVIGAGGGLGHLAVQYGVAMGVRVIAVDLGSDKLDFCKSIGAEFCVDVNSCNPAQQIVDYTSGGAHAIIVFATHSSSYGMAQSCCRKKGTIVCVSLPSGNIEVNVVDLVLHRITIRGSIVGTREDLREALDFAARGLVTCKISKERLENINNVRKRMERNEITGRIVFSMD